MYAHLKVLPGLFNFSETALRNGVPRGMQIGMIGKKSENGFWRPHLHLQLFAGIDGVTDWEKFSKEMDGYVKLDDRAEWARKCPDPTPLLFA